MTDDKPANATAEAMKKALAAKRGGGAGGAPVPGGFGPDRGGEKTVSARNVALNKPAFRRASKRG